MRPPQQSAAAAANRGSSVPRSKQRPADARHGGHPLGDGKGPAGTKPMNPALQALSA
jgi:hypothetical protein